MRVARHSLRQEPAPALFRLISDGVVSRAALNACGFPIALLDAAASTRSVSYANRAFESFFGYRDAEVLGRSLAELVFRGDEALMHRLLAEPASRWQIRAWAKDGSPRHVELSLAAIRNAEGRVASWVAAFSDRGELERLRRELQALRALAVTV